VDIGTGTLIKVCRLGRGRFLADEPYRVFIKVEIISIRFSKPSTVGYSDFNKSMGLTSKRSLIIFLKMFVKKSFLKE
jgi:hypothetical protein